MRRKQSQTGLPGEAIKGEMGDYSAFIIYKTLPLSLGGADGSRTIRASSSSASTLPLVTTM